MSYVLFLNATTCHNRLTYVTGRDFQRGGSRRHPAMTSFISGESVIFVPDWTCSKRRWVRSGASNTDRLNARGEIGGRSQCRHSQGHTPSLRAPLSGTFLQRSDVVNQCLKFESGDGVQPGLLNPVAVRVGNLETELKIKGTFQKQTLIQHLTNKQDKVCF